MVVDQTRVFGGKKTTVSQNQDGFSKKHIHSHVPVKFSCNSVPRVCDTLTYSNCYHPEPVTVEVITWESTARLKAMVRQNRNEIAAELTQTIIVDDSGFLRLRSRLDGNDASQTWEREVWRLLVRGDRCVV